MRLIDADALREVHCQYCSEAIRNGCKDDPVCASLLWVDEAPTVDAVPVVHGKWLGRPKNEGWEDEDITVIGTVNGEPWASCYCSECGEWLVASDEYSVKGNYCPNCGAKMDGEPE